MVWFGVPIFDWVLLVFVLGLGVEAYLTTRPSRAKPADEPGAESKVTKDREESDALAAPDEAQHEGP